MSFWINFAKTGAAQFVAVKGYNDGRLVRGLGADGLGLRPALARGRHLRPAGSPTSGDVPPRRLRADGRHASRSSSIRRRWERRTVADTATPAKSPFQVGGFAPGGVTVATGQSVVDGVVDDLAIWHRALVADERAYLATHAVP